VNKFVVKTQNRNAVKFWNDIPKRLIDIVLSLLGVVLLAPAFAIIAVLIRRDSPGPVFFRGKRAGYKGKPFWILKFRTMYETPDSYNGSKITASEDSRVTQLGRWLRKTKLNELPQLWNVLKGDMSLVGPRPEDYDIARTWSKDVFEEVLSVRPGITGPASVTYRNEEAMIEQDGMMDTYINKILPTKLRMDQLYVRHRSILLDLDVLLWTFLILLPKLGDFSPSEKSLFIGPTTWFVRRYANWFLLDALASFFSIGVVGLFWRSYGPLDVGVSTSLLFALAFTFLFSIVGLLMGTHRIVWDKAANSDIFQIILASVLATVVAAVVNRHIPNYYTPNKFLFPEGLIIISALLTTIMMILARYRKGILNTLINQFPGFRFWTITAQERVLLIGSGESAQLAAWWLRGGRRGDAFRIIGCLDDDLFKQGLRINGIEVLGKCHQVERLVRKHDVGILVFAIHNIKENRAREILDLCKRTDAKLLIFPNVLERLEMVMNHASSNGTRDIQSAKSVHSAGAF